MGKIYSIRQILNDDELDVCTDIICSAFMTVAQDFNLTRENCPSYASFRTVEQIRSLKEDGFLMYSLFDEKIRVGFVCFKEIEKGVYLLGLLSVLPEYRHLGHGKRLLDFALDYIKTLQGQKIKIWIMNENTVLKNWYINYGFLETGIRKSADMPFTICDMELNVI